jgi:arylsulfatase A-like enzyme
METRRTAPIATMTALALLALVGIAWAQTPAKKPNILVIMGDDIGWFNPSVYHRGIMGYETPNIDRIAHEGAMFTDWYGQQSCTAGRAAFVTGQSPIRTGLTKVGLPGADIGLRAEDPSVAEILKPLGYATGQFGKNHLGDKDEFLPTNHGFDEFFGNLYHLNAEEEPDNPDYPKSPEFRKRFGPRGVIHSFADGKIEDTGPLTRKRMETVDQEFLTAALDFIDRQHKAGKPFFCYFNSTRMHIFTHLKPESAGRTGLGVYPDGMVEHDGHVGQLLKKLDDLGITNDTLVVYTTDNGAEVMSWPDGGTTPFKGEKATNWEGAFRVPTLIRWPGVIKPGTTYNNIFAHEDLIPTFAAAGGDPDVVARCLKGCQRGRRRSRSISTATTSCPSSRARRRNHRARSSSTGATTATWSPSASTTGRSRSRSRTTPAWTSGSGTSRTCARRTSTTCAPTRSSAAPNRSSTANG